MKERKKLFQSALENLKLVSVSHDTKRSGHRNRSKALVENVADEYVTLYIPGKGYRNVRYDSIYTITVYP